MYPDLFPRPMNSTAWSEDRASSATQSAEGSTFFMGELRTKAAKV